MIYPNFVTKTVNIITNHEANIICDIVEKHKPNKILEIGTFGGYATMHFAYSLAKVTGGKITTIDFKRDLNPKPEDAISEFGLLDYVEFVKFNDENELFKNIEKYTNDVDMIFIDMLHDKMDILVEKIIEETNKDFILILHDVNCEYCEEMKTPNVYETLSKNFNTENIKTHDLNNFENGIGIIFVKKMFFEKNDEGAKEIESEIQNIVDKADDTKKEENNNDNLTTESVEINEQKENKTRRNKKQISK